MPSDFMAYFNRSALNMIAIYARLSDTLLLLQNHCQKRHTKREGNIWHNLGGNTIILFFNINNGYMNNKQIN